LKRYFASIKQYSWVVLVCLVIATLGGVVLAKASPTVYQVSTTLYVNMGAPDTTFTTTGAGSGTPSDSQTEATNYASEIPTTVVMQYVLQKYPELQRHGFTADDLVADTIVVASLTGPTVSITGEALKPNDAVMIANDVSYGFVAYTQAQLTNQLDKLRSNIQTQLTSYQNENNSLETKIQQLNPTSPLVNLYTVDRADVIHNIDTLQGQLQSLPTSIQADVSVVQSASANQVAPTTKASLIVAASAGLGLVIGIVAMLLLIFFDSRLRREEEVKSKLRMAYLGGVSKSSELMANPAQPSDKVAQELSDIVANLALTGTLPEQWRVPRGAVLLVTSPRVAEGKTTLAAALAATVGRSGRNVAVIDANLRQPALHLAFGNANASYGLSALLQSAGNEPLDSVVQRSNEPNVWLLPAGTPMADPLLLLQQKLPAILDQLRTRVDLVIIDGPALLQSADASFLARSVDGVAMVVDMRHEKLSTLLRAKELLVNLTRTPAGVIMNFRTGLSKKAPYYAAVYPAKSEAIKEELARAAAMNSNGNGNGNGQNPGVETVSTAMLGSVPYPSYGGRQMGQSPLPSPNELPMMLMNPPTPFPLQRKVDTPQSQQ
jgi:protein-tyrosine kinase